MQTLNIVFVFALILSSVRAYSCPKADPKGFTVFEKNAKGTVFSNKEKSAVLGLTCLKMSPEEAKRTVGLFPNSVPVAAEIHKVTLAKTGDASTTLFLRTTETELIQLTLTTKTADPKQQDATEQLAVDYLNSK